MDDLGDHAFGLIEWLYPDNWLAGPCAAGGRRH
jgi:hypothetical protein